MEFTKSMLRNGYVVEYRNGERGIYLDGFFSDINDGMNLDHFNNDLTFHGDRSYDIVAIYKPEGNLSLRDVVHSSGDPIWKREEFHEISMGEAIKKLEEVYGKPVKIIDRGSDLISRLALYERCRYFCEHTPEPSPQHYAYRAMLREIENAPIAISTSNEK